MSFANNDRFTILFPICMSFLSSFLIAVARTSSTMLNETGENEYPCLVPNLKGMLLVFAIEYDVRCYTMSYSENNKCKWLINMKNTQAQRESERMKVRTTMRYTFFSDGIFFLSGRESCAGKNEGKYSSVSKQTI